MHRVAWCTFGALPDRSIKIQKVDRLPTCSFSRVLCAEIHFEGYCAQKSILAVTSFVAQLSHGLPIQPADLSLVATGADRKATAGFRGEPTAEFAGAMRVDASADSPAMIVPSSGDC